MQFKFYAIFVNILRYYVGNALQTSAAVIWWTHNKIPPIPWPYRGSSEPIRLNKTTGVKLPDGTAAVCAKVNFVTKVGHWGNPGRLKSPLEARVRRPTEWVNLILRVMGCGWFLYAEKRPRHHLLMPRCCYFRKGSSGRTDKSRLLLSKMPQAHLNRTSLHKTGGNQK